MSENRDVYVVVPAFNEASVIGRVVSELRETFPNVVCVDDGSSDGTAQVASAAGAIVVQHPDNLGQGAALQTGLALALRDPSMRFVITFDGDGQHRVGDAIDMVASARDSGDDVVLGSRFLGATAGEMPLRRRAILRAAIVFTRLTTRLTITDAHNGLRVLSRSAVARIEVTLHGMAHASEFLHQIARGDMTYHEHPITVDYTDYSLHKGQSNINAVNIVFDLLAARLRAGR